MTKLSLVLPPFSTKVPMKSEIEIKLMTDQANRRGRVVFQDVAKQINTGWGTSLETMVKVLDLDNKVY